MSYKQNTNSKIKMLPKNKKLKGSVLAYVLVIMTVVLIVLTSMIGFVVSQLKFSYYKAEREKAFQIAEAGVYYFRWYLAHETSGKTAQDIENFWQSGNVIGASSYEADFEGIGKYKIETTLPDPGSIAVNVKVTGWTYKMPDSSRTVRVRFRRSSWSEYIFLSNDFINIGNQSEVWGKIFSNNGIRFDGIAHNTVSSLLPSFNDPTWGGNKLQFGVHTTVNPADPDAPDYPWPDGTVPTQADIFMGGRVFPASQVSFTGVTTDLANMKSQAENGNGKYFDNSGTGRKILLKSDGTYDVCTINSYSSQTKVIDDYGGIVTGATESYSGTNGNPCVTSVCCLESSCPYIKASKPDMGKCASLTNYPIINNGVIFVENNIWVDGAINGKRITIVAADLLGGGGGQADLYIGTENNNFSYASFDCDNMIGLVAQRDIRVLGSCPNDYVVDAALLAQTGVVGINENGFSSHNSLTFNGAIASYLQPYFQHGNSGFAERVYYFDNNLLYCPPPYFPTGTDYSIDLWEEL